MYVYYYHFLFVFAVGGEWGTLEKRVFPSNVVCTELFPNVLQRIGWHWRCGRGDQSCPLLGSRSWDGLPRAWDRESRCFFEGSFESGAMPWLHVVGTLDASRGPVRFMAWVLAINLTVLGKLHGEPGAAGPT